MRTIAATWLILGVSFSTCSVSLSTPAIKETGANGERAAEIMRVAESSCGFPIFGNGRSSRSCGFTDSSRASWSCSKTRSPHSKDIYVSRDEGRIYSQGVTGASSRCCHSVECTCSQSSDSRCTADVKVTTAVQLSAVLAVVGGAVAQDTEWPVWLMKATWIRLLKRAKGGRVKSSDACVSSIWVCLHHESQSVLCACACVCCGVTITSISPQHGVSVARFCIAWWWWEAECCYQLWLSGSGQSSISPPSDPLGCCSWTRPFIRQDLMT